jgi:ribosomal-protein-alanine N-acetyltransferase
MLIMENIFFKNNEIILRRFRRSDWQALMNQANNPGIGKYLPLMESINNETEAIKWINTGHRLFREKKACYLAIEDVNSRKMIGSMNLKNINMTDRNAEVEYWLDNRFWRRGIASESLAPILKYAFSDMDLVRVYAIVHAKNTASIKLLEKFGFTREGTYRKATFMNDEWSDVYSYGLLKEEFPI